jgi:hypothetical protein
MSKHERTLADRVLSSSGQGQTSIIDDVFHLPIAVVLSFSILH